MSLHLCDIVGKLFFILIDCGAAYHGKTGVSELLYIVKSGLSYIFLVSFLGFLSQSFSYLNSPVVMAKMFL